MQMTDAEIARSYRQAPEGQKQKQIKILSELNACDKKQIREILRSQGFDVKEPKNRWTAAREAGQTSDCKDCAKGETCGFGKPDGVRCDEFRAKDSEGSKVSARLLKSEEPAGVIKSDEPEEVGTRQQEVGTKSEKVVTLGEYDEDTIQFAENELRVLNELIEAMEQDIKRRRLEIRANKCKAEYLRLWLQNVKGGTDT